MDNDLEHRTTLSKVLGAPLKKKDPYEYKSEQIVYSWGEIYYEIGRLAERASQNHKQHVHETIN